MASEAREEQWSRLSDFIAETIGLHFPRERRDDLERGLAAAAQELGFEDAAACLGWLLSAPPTKPQLHVLASHLTVGETYFFRDKQALEALAENILPGFVRTRRGRDQRLRVWSAACCTGEEAYSLAILLHQVLPDMRDWRVTITATDVNARFLQKAAAGVYSEWSFRDVPAGLRERYFNRTADGRFVIVQEIKQLVTFSQMNLVDSDYSSLAAETNPIDLILCRNVLMYFTPPQIKKVIGNLRHALVDGGWLAVSPSEASKELFPGFIAENFPGAILFQKSSALAHAEQAPVPPESKPELALPEFQSSLPRAASPIRGTDPQRTPAKKELARVATASGSMASTEALYREGRYAEVADTLLAAFAGCPPESGALSLLARALANQGKLDGALAWCDRWITADKLDPAGHYLRALVLLEQGNPEPARASLQRAIYLRPDFVLAHVALGNLARGRGKPGEGDKHLGNALQLLARQQPNDVLPESDGLTVGRLMETITSICKIAP